MTQPSVTYSPKKVACTKFYFNLPTDDNKTAFYGICHLVQQRVCGMQNARTARKSEETQGYADHNEWKNLFAAIKAVYGPKVKGTAPLVNADDGILLTEKTQTMKYWAEHFRSVRKRPSTISDAVIDRVPQVETIADTDLPPCRHETIRVETRIYSGKASGSNAIHAEIYKHGDPQLMNHPTTFFQMCRQGEVPRVSRTV
nr:unnamed protein product [Spirometra erinaceieuropaei]